MNIEMPRGDIRHVAFQILDTAGEPVSSAFSEIYITFKQNYNTTNYLFQKRLSAGDVIFADGSYEFTIEPEDTNNLKFGDYVFDIELLAPGIKETHVGTLTLTSEATHQQNEG